MKMKLSDIALTRVLEYYELLRKSRKIETVDPGKLSKLQKMPLDVIEQLISIKGAIRKEP